MQCESDRGVSEWPNSQSELNLEAVRRFEQNATCCFFKTGGQRKQEASCYKIKKAESTQPHFKAHILKSRAAARENPHHIRLISTRRGRKFDHETSEFVHFPPPGEKLELGHMGHAVQIQAMIMLSKHIISSMSLPHQLQRLL